MMREPAVFLVAGERSGDHHGAALIRSLKEMAPGLHVAGFGGPEMRAAGGEGIEDWVEEAGVVGLVEVLRKYPYFRRKFDDALSRIARLGPAAIVFIDYPGFNLRLAEALARSGSTARRIFYISPQVWAWNRRRIPRMASILHRMLCIFPFEKALYEESGLPTEFVGHPLVEQLGASSGSDDGGSERERGLVGLFPGSRAREVEKHFPVLLEVGRILMERGTANRLIASAASDRMRDLMIPMREAAGIPPDRCPIEVGNARALMRRAWVGAVASGTATLEAAVLGLPYCLVYRVAWPTYLAGRLVVDVKHLGMANILAGREIVREFLQTAATPRAIAEELSALAIEGPRRSAMLEDLSAVAATLGGADVHGRAARAILSEIGSSPPSPPP